MFTTYIINKKSMMESLSTMFCDDVDELKNKGYYYAEKVHASEFDIQDFDQPIYTLFCDILSIDYEALAKDIYLIPQNINYDPRSEDSKFELGGLIFQRLNQENHFLVNTEILDRIFRRIDDKYYASFCLNEINEKKYDSVQLPRFMKEEIFLKREDAQEMIDDRIADKIKEHRMTLNGFENNYKDVLCCFSHIINYRNYVDAVMKGNELLYNFPVFLKFIQHYEEGKFSTEFLNPEYVTLGGDYKSLDNGDSGFEVEPLYFDMFLQELSINPAKHSYACNTLSELLSTSLINILEDHLSFNKCQHCGKYFVAYNRSDTKYCERPSKEDPTKTCREYANYIKYLDKNKNDKATKLYRNIYNSLGNKYRRTKNKKLNAEIKNLQLKNKQWKSDVKQGKKTEEEYINWLSEIKESKRY